MCVCACVYVPVCMCVCVLVCVSSAKELIIYTSIKYSQNLCCVSILTYILAIINSATTSFSLLLIITIFNNMERVFEPFWMCMCWSYGASIIYQGRKKGEAIYRFLIKHCLYFVLESIQNILCVYSIFIVQVCFHIHI